MTTTDIITALQADPMNADRVHIFVDGRHVMSVALDVAANEQLTVGQPCPPERIERLHTAEELNGIYEEALNFLTFRPRSAREVEQRLRKKNHTPEQISAVMDRLRRRGYVDDREFARFWIGNRMAFAPRGSRLLKSELFQKGVPADIIDEVLAEHQESQEEREQVATEVAEEYGLQGEEPAPGTDLANAVALARKRMRLVANLDPQVARRRLFSALARRGYDYETIDAAIKRVMAPPEDEGELFD